MDMFDQRRTLSLALGIAALCFAFLVLHVNGAREAARAVAPAEVAAAADRG